MAIRQTKRRSDIETLPISFDQLMRKLEETKSTSKEKITLSDEQKTFLLNAVKLKISYSKSAELWALRWGEISRSGIKRRINFLQGKKPE